MNVELSLCGSSRVIRVLLKTFKVYRIGAHSFTAVSVTVKTLSWHRMPLRSTHFLLSQSDVFLQNNSVIYGCRQYATVIPHSSAFCLHDAEPNILTHQMRPVADFATGRRLRPSSTNVLSVLASRLSKVRDRGLCCGRTAGLQQYMQSAWRHLVGSVAPGFTSAA